MPPLPVSIRALLDALADADATVHWEAAKALSALRDTRVVPPLIALAQGGGASGQRAAAVYALGWLRDSRALAPLVQVLRDSREDAQLRGHAAEALAYIGQRRAVPALITALDDPAPEVRLWSAFALGEMGDRRAVAPLERLAATDVTPVPGWRTVGEEARQALKRLEAVRRRHHDP
jgi:HEAT repeat protein